MHTTARLLAVLVFAVAARCEGVRDPVFDKIPFEEWLNAKTSTRMRWSVHVLPAVLSNEQRLVARLGVQVDGRELERRRGKGYFVFLVQVTDETGEKYQSHGVINLNRMSPEIASSHVAYAQRLFVLPGKYEIAAALFVPETGEYAVRREKLNVPHLKNDPLEAAWRGLPPVAFETGASSRGPLQLSVGASKPVAIEIFLNLPAPVVEDRRMRTYARERTDMLAALRLLTNLQLPRGSSVNVSVLDLARRKVAYRQTGVHAVNWRALGAALRAAASSANTIEVEALEGARQTGTFISAEISRAAAASSGDAAPVVVVLSPPIRLQGETPPVKAEGAGFQYIRFRSTPKYALERDDLEAMLKPVRARVHDVEKPRQFRSALAEIIGELSRIGD